MGWFRRETPVVVPDMASGSLSWCRTTRCPKCNAPGYLDRIDLVDCTTGQHCPECRHRWETREQTATPRSA